MAKFLFVFVFVFVFVFIFQPAFSINESRFLFHVQTEALPKMPASKKQIPTVLLGLLTSIFMPPGAAASSKSTSSIQEKRARFINKLEGKKIKTYVDFLVHMEGLDDDDDGDVDWRKLSLIFDKIDSHDAYEKNEQELIDCFFTFPEGISNKWFSNKTRVEDVQNIIYLCQSFPVSNDLFFLLGQPALLPESMNRFVKVCVTRLKYKQIELGKLLKLVRLQEQYMDQRVNWHTVSKKLEEDCLMAASVPFDNSFPLSPGGEASQAQARLSHEAFNQRETGEASGSLYANQRLSDDRQVLLAMIESFQAVDFSPLAFLLLRSVVKDKKGFFDSFIKPLDVDINYNPDYSLEDYLLKYKQTGKKFTELLYQIMCMPNDSIMDINLLNSNLQILPSSPNERFALHSVDNSFLGVNRENLSLLSGHENILHLPEIEKRKFTEGHNDLKGLLAVLLPNDEASLKLIEESVDDSNFFDVLNKTFKVVSVGEFFRAELLRSKLTKSCAHVSLINAVTESVRHSPIDFDDSDCGYGYDDSDSDSDCGYGTYSSKGDKLKEFIRALPDNNDKEAKRGVSACPCCKVNENKVVTMDCIEGVHGFGCFQCAKKSFKLSSRLTCHFCRAKVGSLKRCFLN